MVFLTLPWSNSVSPSVFIGQVLTSGSFVFSPRGVVRQGLNRVLTPWSAFAATSFFPFPFPPRFDPDRLSRRAIRYRSRDEKNGGLRPTPLLLLFSAPRFRSVRLARIMRPLEEEERGGGEREGDRGRKKRDYAAVPRTRY